MKKMQFLMIVLASIACSNAHAIAVAQDSDGVCRVFGVTLGGNSILDGCPDWFGDDSRRLVVVGPESNPRAIEFANPWEYRADLPDEDWQIRDEDGVILDLHGTSWRLAPTLHVTVGGPDVTPDYVWLQPVTAGVTCPTGPAGDVLVQHSFLIKQITDTADPDYQKYVVVNSGADALFCVGIGVFNK